MGLPKNSKDLFSYDLISVLSNVKETEIRCGNLNGHIGELLDAVADVYGGCAYGSRNAEGERILVLADAFNLWLRPHILRSAPTIS